MFTNKAQAVIDLAKDHASSNGSAELNLPAVLAAMGHQSESVVLLRRMLPTLPRASSWMPAPSTASQRPARESCCWRLRCRPCLATLRRWPKKSPTDCTPV